MVDAARHRIKTPLPFLFRALPSSVMASKTLSSTGKLLFAAIVDATRGNRSGLCKVANKTLGDRIGRGESEVGRYLLELEAAGLIERRFGQSKNVRIGIAVTWTETVPEDPGTPRDESTSVREPGSARTGNPVPHDPGPGRIPVDPMARTGVSFDSRGTEPKPSPEETARAMRAMIAGRFAPMLFAQPEPEPGGPEIPPAPTPRPPTPPTPIPLPPTPPSRTPRSGGFDPTRVGYSAVAAIAHGSPPRKTATQQLEELRRWSHGRST